LDGDEKLEVAAGASDTVDRSPQEVVVEARVEVSVPKESRDSGHLDGCRLEGLFKGCLIKSTNRCMEVAGATLGLAPEKNHSEIASRGAMTLYIP
jgi:hypothetical protein